MFILMGGGAHKGLDSISFNESFIKVVYQSIFL